MRTERSRWGRRVGRGFVAVVLLSAGLTTVRTLVLADLNEAQPPSSVVQGHVAVGGLHTCAVLTDGAAQCWGNNDRGQLGNGTVTASTQPVTASGITSATAVTAGNTHTCVLLADQTVKCWGLAANGQLGDGSTGDPAAQSSRLNPVTVVGLSGAAAIAAGGFQTCAVTGGAVKCWGDDGMGQLGDGAPGDRSLSAKPVPGISTATAIAAGEFHTCALLTNSTVKCWGHNGFGQLGDGTKTDRSAPVLVAGLPDPVANPNQVPVALTAGNGHTCVLLKDDSARCWGQNAHGQLGRPTPDADGDGVMDPSTTPLTVQHDADPGPLTNLQDLSGMKSISAGQFHTCARMSGDSARCFGNNKRGQLGTDPDPLTPGLQNSSSAVEVSGLSGATAVTAGGFHSCAVVGGGMKCWGYNFYGQLGFRAPYSRIPIQVTTLTGATSVTTGTGFACALTNADTPNKPVCWGDNADGRLGAGSGVPDSTIRVALSGVASALAIDAGNGHGCVLPAGSSTPLCWGFNGTGQVGDATTTSRTAPVPVSGLTTATSISAGGGRGSAERGHTCATQASGKVGCWGRNLNGQLGDNSSTDRTTPVTVQADTDPTSAGTSLADLAGASAVVTGGFHSCALTSGTVWCWGFNGSGQLGDNTTTERHWAVPVQVDTDPEVNAPLTGVVALTAGQSHTCAQINDGTVRCWGENSSGQLGDTTVADRHLPATVSTITAAMPAEVITAGDFHTCARLADGSMKCWGANGDGQLGDGSTTNSPTPKVVASSAHGLDFGPTDGDVPAEVRPVITSISASRRNTCASVVDTTVYCWGDNTHGQLGDGVGPASVAPVTVTALAGSV